MLICTTTGAQVDRTQSRSLALDAVDRAPFPHFLLPRSAALSLRVESRRDHPRSNIDGMRAY